MYKRQIKDTEVCRKVLEFIGVSIDGDEEISQPLYGIPSVIYLAVIDKQMVDLKYDPQEQSVGYL